MFVRLPSVGVELEFTGDQEELRTSVRAVLARECPISLVREVVEKGTTPDGLWARMVELDWPALTVAESHGGIGLGFIELIVVLEELGRVLAPGPLTATTALFAPALRECGSDDQQARFLGGVAAGTLTGTLAFPDRPAIEADAVDEVVLVDGDRAIVVPRDRLSVTPVESFDRSRRLAKVVLDGEVEGDRVLAHPERLPRAVEEATVAVAVETVGTCQAIFDIALDYAKNREQFGVPIGSFQAIKHKFADMYVALERARATAYFAAVTVAEDDERRTVATSMAKAAAGDAQRLIAQEGIQIMGGIGYTWEHDMHLYVKRAKSGDALFGTAAEHRARIADHLGV
jgi:alkylation response protein AidB-like acyl-CoA dehydrogenase